MSLCLSFFAALSERATSKQAVHVALPSAPILEDPPADEESDSSLDYDLPDFPSKTKVQSKTLPRQVPRPAGSGGHPTPPCSVSPRDTSGKCKSLVLCVM